MMDLDSAIRHCDEVADGQTAQGKCPECAEDHRQLASWLRELKAYKAEEYTCDGCKHFDHGEEIECWACSRHHIKKYDNWEAKE